MSPTATPVTLRSTGGESVTVSRSGGETVVEWACTPFRFSDARLRQFVETVERFADTGVLVAFTAGSTFTVEVEGDTLHGAQGYCIPAGRGHRIEWKPLLAAIKKLGPEWE